MLAVRDLEIELKNTTFDASIENPREPCKTLLKHAIGGAFLSKVYLIYIIYVCKYMGSKDACIWLTVVKYVVPTIFLLERSELFPRFVPGSSKYALTLLPFQPANSQRSWKLPTAGAKGRFGIYSPFVGNIYF